MKRILTSILVIAVCSVWSVSALGYSKEAEAILGKVADAAGIESPLSLPENVKTADIIDEAIAFLKEDKAGLKAIPTKDLHVFVLIRNYLYQAAFRAASPAMYVNRMGLLTCAALGKDACDMKATDFFNTTLGKPIDVDDVEDFLQSNLTYYEMVFGAFDNGCTDKLCIDYFGGSFPAKFGYGTYFPTFVTSVEQVITHLKDKITPFLAKDSSGKYVYAGKLRVILKLASDVSIADFAAKNTDDWNTLLKLADLAAIESIRAVEGMLSGSGSISSSFMSSTVVDGIKSDNLPYDTGYPYPTWAVAKIRHPDGHVSKVKIVPVLNSAGETEGFFNKKLFSLFGGSKGYAVPLADDSITLDIALYDAKSDTPKIITAKMKAVDGVVGVTADKLEMSYLKIH